MRADLAKKDEVDIDIGCGFCRVLHIRRPMKSRGDASSIQLFNYSYVGMTADATENVWTTGRQSGSNASHGNSAAGAAAAPSSSSNPGQCLEASNRRNNCRPREVGRGCPGDDGAESARAALPPCVASGLSGSGPYVFRCGHSRVTIELKQIMCAFIARRICRTP